MIAGGLRDRLIEESFVIMLTDALDLLGWFDSGLAGSDNFVKTPITVVGKIDDDTPVPFNTIAVAVESIEGEDIELGSNLRANGHEAWVDFYAQSGPTGKALGQHVIGDIRDILTGNHADAGRADPSFAVLDLTIATPAPIFYCDIENVASDRARGFTEEWRRNWFSCSATLVEKRP